MFAADAKCAVIELGCWAHARRKFFDLQVSGAHPQAAEAVRRIGKLYAIEEQARAMDHAARAQHRQQNSAPMLTDMHEWLIRLRVATADGSGLARAIDYSLHRWPSLIRYAQTGNLPIDNNPVENAIHPFVIGRKAWLFSDTPAGAHASAVIYSLLQTAKTNGHEPYAWLRRVMRDLPAAKMVEEIEALLPWNLHAMDLTSEMVN